MKTLRGRPQFAILKEPKRDPRLEGFSCGTVEQWEDEVNKLVLELYEHGRERYPTMTTLVMCGEGGQTLGVCAWRPRRLVIGEDSEDDGYRPPYVHVIGLSEPFRDHVSEAGVRLGSELLLEAMRVIDQQWTGDEMPDVWALVHRDNEPSHKLFKRHGFEPIEREHGDVRRVRPAGVPVG